MTYRGFNVFGQSGDWTASSSDCEGWGRTKDRAVESALSMRRGNREDAERDSDEERKIDAILYGPETTCDCGDDAEENDQGNCSRCDGHVPMQTE